MQYLNSELIQSSEHIAQLRAMEIALFVQRQSWQSLHVYNEMERLRLAVAFLQMLFAKQRIHKMLYLVISSSFKETVQYSIERHTLLTCTDIEQYSVTTDTNSFCISQEICLASLSEFSNLFISTEQVQQFLSQFDFVIVEHSDLKFYDLIRYRLQYIYRQAVMEIVYKPQKLYL